MSAIGSLTPLAPCSEGAWYDVDLIEVPGKIWHVFYTCLIAPCVSVVCGVGRWLWSLLSSPDFRRDIVKDLIKDTLKDWIRDTLIRGVLI